MSFKMVMLPPGYHEDWPQRVAETVPGAQVRVFSSPEEALREIEDADCAYGYLPAKMFACARRLRWVQCYAAGPDPSFYHDALVNSDVTVTNFRGIYSDIVSHHALALLLALARRLDRYAHQQAQGEWEPAPRAAHLPDSTVVVVGVGGIGAEVARLCKAFGMTTLGVDPRLEVAPDYLDELHPPDGLDSVLPRADFVVITTPDTPHTRGMMNAGRFALMKPTAYLVNVGRGACVVLQDLVGALNSGALAGAGLDVFETEPLPQGHPLWTTPGVMITPHVGSRDAPHLPERRTHVFLENCRRFSRGQSLINVVDKGNRF